MNDYTTVLYFIDQVSVDEMFFDEMTWRHQKSLRQRVRENGKESHVNKPPGSSTYTG
jgi:hypothetical protein